MRLSEDVKDIYNHIRISIREISMSNPLDNRPHHGFPLTFKIRYFVTGKAPKELRKEGAPDRAIILQECEDTINVAMMNLEDKDRERLMESMYVVKSILEGSSESNWTKIMSVSRLYRHISYYLLEVQRIDVYNHLISQGALYVGYT